MHMITSTHSQTGSSHLLHVETVVDYQVDQANKNNIRYFLNFTMRCDWLIVDHEFIFIVNKWLLFLHGIVSSNDNSCWNYIGDVMVSIECGRSCVRVQGGSRPKTIKLVCPAASLSSLL